MDKKQLKQYVAESYGGITCVPCGCNECRAGDRGELSGRRWGEGHAHCRTSDPELLKAEEEGLAFAQFFGELGWRWQYA
jgi:hypothetical protein